TQIYTLSLHDALPILNYAPETTAPIDEELLSQGKPVSFRTRYRRADGDARSVDATVSLAHSGDGEVYIVSFKDITEQKQVARERSEEHTSELQSRGHL